MSVRQEPRPDYQAEGVLVGGFMIYPKVSVAGTYDDNIYDLQTGGVGDFIFSETPEIDIQSTWARNSLSAYVKAEGDEYATYSSQDALQYGTGLAGKYELLGNSVLSGGVDFAHDVLPRSASNNVGLSVHPIPYDLTTLNGEFVSTLTRVRLSIRVDDQIYDYQNGETAGNTVVDEEQYNHNALTVTGKAELAISPDAAVYLTAAGNNRNYQYLPPVSPYDLNSTGYDIEAGANFDITHLVRGEVQLGYLDQNYAEASVFKPISGPALKVQVQWFPTQLTTVTAVANRTVADAGVPGSAGFLLTNGSIQIDHELLRNVILSGQGSYGTDVYNGIDRTDDIASAGFSANWLLNRHIGLTLAYTYTDQTSSGAQAGASYQDNRVMLSANFQY